MLDMWRLSIFHAVAEHGSISAASRALYITHSAVSQQVAVLERELGISLLERSSRGVRVTEAGKLVVARFVTLLEIMNGLERDVADLRRQPTQVRLGAFPAAGGYIVPGILRDFLRRYKGAMVGYVPIDVDEASARVRDRTIDICLVWDYAFAPRDFGSDLARLHLFDDPLYVLLPAGHRLAAESVIALKQLASEPWIVRHTRPYADQSFAELCNKAGFEPNVAWSTENYQGAQGLVAADLGVSLAPRMSLAAMHEGVVALPLQDRTHARRIAVISLTDAGATAAATNMLTLIKDRTSTIGRRSSGVIRPVHGLAPDSPLSDGHE